MQIFIIGTPLETAQCLDKKRLNSQINECTIILRAINGAKAWSNHPIVSMWKNDASYLKYYRRVLENYMNGWETYDADVVIPIFITQDFLDQMKRRLYTKDPIHYAQFAEYGTSDENWYIVDGILRKYVNGKRIN